MATTIVIIAAALVAAAVVVGVVVSRRKPTAAPPNQELVRAVDEMRSKMDELAGELSGALERAEQESRRNRLFGELGGSIDLEELMDRVLDAAMEIPGIEAAMIVVERQDGAPAVVTRGMSAEESARPPTSGVAGTLPGTITVSYRYGRDREGVDMDLIRGGAFVPLMGRELRPVGTLSLFWRDPDHEPSSDEIDQAEHLAASSISAIENARRYGEARKLAETDGLTGLHNQRYFQETLRREVTRAHRYQRKLTLIVFDLDDFKSINDQVGHLAGDRVLAQAADRLREAVRSVDVASRIGGDEFAVIMPESTAEDGEQLFRRVHNSMRGTALGPDEQRLRLSGGIAELLHGDTPASLFERADAALYRAKELGKDRADIARAGELRRGSGPARELERRVSVEPRRRGFARAVQRPSRRDDDARSRAETPGEEHGSLDSDELRGPDRCGTRRDDPRAIRLPDVGTLEPANENRRTTAASDGEDEPARPRERDPLRARLGKEREHATLDGRSDRRASTSEARRRAPSAGDFSVEAPAESTAAAPSAIAAIPASTPSVASASGDGRRALGTSTAHKLAAVEPMSSPSMAGSRTTGMSGTVVTEQTSR